MIKHLLAPWSAIVPSHGKADSDVPGRWAGRRAVTVCGLLLLASGCESPQSSLHPEGPGAAQTLGLFWLMFWLALAVFVAVMALLAYALLRASRAGPEPRGPRIGDTRFILLAGLVVPVPILFIVMVASIRTGAELSAPPTPPALVVEVIGHQFWWEVRYPDHDVFTANEIHIPAGVPVELRLTSADVIHSLWVPQLATKMDLVPGKVNSIWLQADEPGIYRGQCAEFCGIQHALMGFLVIAEPPEQFALWLEQQREPAPEPVDGLLQEGQRQFFELGCAHCHVVRGVVEMGPAGAVGPDLTHFATRGTIGAATVDNTAANLAQWVVDPHVIKPGNRMPPTVIEGEALLALIAYLESLE